MSKSGFLLTGDKFHKPRGSQFEYCEKGGGRELADITEKFFAFVKIISKFAILFEEERW